jgi:hypothetical protein
VSGPSWNRWELHPTFARRIENGEYFLFGVPCTQEVMAAYERLHLGIRKQENGDRIVAWIALTVLTKGDPDFGGQLFDALEVLGWSRSGR